MRKLRRPSGPRELIESDRNGLLIPPQDVIALSEALQRLAADPVLRRRLGAEASKIGEKFSPVLVYAKWLELIDTVSAKNQVHYALSCPSQPEND